MAKWSHDIATVDMAVDFHLTQGKWTVTQSPSQPRTLVPTLFRPYRRPRDEGDTLRSYTDGDSYATMRLRCCVVDRALDFFFLNPGPTLPSLRVLLRLSVQQF